MKNTILIILLSLFIVDKVEGQKVIVKKRKVDSETPMEQEDSDDEDYDYSEATISLKTNIATYFVGDFPITAEYFISEWVSVEAGIGYLQRNFLGDILFNGPFGYRTILDQGSCDGCDYQYDAGISYQLKLKYFFEFGSGISFFHNSGFEDDYISLSINHRPYSGTAKVDGFSGTSQWQYHATDVGLNLGSQYGQEDSFMFEYYAGVALRFENSIYPYYNSFNFFGSPVGSSQSTEDISFWFNLGFQVGWNP